jgi:hypothetical protein
MFDGHGPVVTNVRYVQLRLDSLEEPVHVLESA